MSDYKPTIGLEIHAELKTRTKMFCNSANDPDENEPNVNVCPVCMGHPGTLPVINKEAVRHVLRVGVACGSQLADFTEFDRKNYFYPDLPKGYQISQYKYPLVSGGSINGIELTRIHLEEDAAKNVHDEKLAGKGHSLIDYNRAGAPLMELVTEPVVKSAKDATAFARELRLLLRYLGASDTDMEKGLMRVEANISVSKTDTPGTKVEVKNLNSFKVVERAIEYEIERQIEVLEDGGKVDQETRGWDENKQETFSQRSKEESHDYRYFPDPDLPKLKLSEIPEFAPEELKKELPELPWEKRDRYRSEYGIKDEDIESFVNDRKLASLFEEVANALPSKEHIKLASNYTTSDVIGYAKSKKKDEQTFGDFILGSELAPAEFVEVINMVQSGDLSSRGAKDLIAILIEEGGKARELAEARGLLQQSDEGELKALIEGIIENNPDAVAEYRAGKEKSIQFLIGQGMKETKGSANPGILKKLFEEMLK